MQFIFLLLVQSFLFFLRCQKDFCLLQYNGGGFNLAGAALNTVHILDHLKTHREQFPPEQGNISLEKSGVVWTLFVVRDVHTLEILINKT